MLVESVACAFAQLPIFDKPNQFQVGHLLSINDRMSYLEFLHSNKIEANVNDSCTFKKSNFTATNTCTRKTNLMSFDIFAGNDSIQWTIHNPIVICTETDRPVQEASDMSTSKHKETKLQKPSNSAPEEKLRVLCLHGYRQNGNTFKSKIGMMNRNSERSEWNWISLMKLIMCICRSVSQTFTEICRICVLNCTTYCSKQPRRGLKRW